MSRNEKKYPVHGLEDRAFLAIDHLPVIIGQHRARGMIPRRQSPPGSIPFKLVGPTQLTGRLKAELSGLFSISITALRRSMQIRANRPELEKDVRSGVITLHAGYVAAGGATRHVTRFGGRRVERSVEPRVNGSVRIRRLVASDVVSDLCLTLEGALPVLEQVSDRITSQDRLRLKPFISRMRRVATCPKEAHSE